MYSRLSSLSELCCPWIWCTLTFNIVILPADLWSINFKCNRLNYNYFAIFMITLLITFNVITTNILVFYVILSRVYLSNISSYFNLFFTQNYELQFSFNVIITCNNKQYTVNYKHFNSNSPFPIFHKICLLLLLYMTSYRIE